MHEYFHTEIGFCLWDVGALIVLAAMVIVLVVHIVRQKKREQELEDRVVENAAKEVYSEKR